MAEYVELPKGFSVDEIPSSQELPKGFTLDAGKEDSFSKDALDVISEFAAGANRGVTEFIDFVGPDTVNAILSLSEKGASKITGEEKEFPRVPTLTDSIPGIKGGYMEPGLARDVVSAAGATSTAATGIAGLTKQAAKLRPDSDILKEIAKTGYKTEAALGAVSGAGGEVGRDAGGDTGALVGSILAPVSASAATAALRPLLSKGAEGIKALVAGTEGMSEKAAAELIGEAFIREGLDEDEILSTLSRLGDEAIPADLGESFSRLMKAAINEVPRLSGVQKNILDARQAGQSSRLVNAFEDSTGTPLLNADDEIVRLNEAFKPQIDEAYARARAVGEEKLFPEPELLPTGIVTPTQKARKAGEVKPKRTKLESLLEGANIVGGTKAAADAELKAKRLAGEKVTKLDIVDANKRAMDDKISALIRKGEMNKARMIIKSKNAILREVDELVPEYKEARSIFAGKAELENAASLGEDFFKLKPRDVKDAAESMGESELKMFKLGAKKALIDKINNMQITADSVKRLFGTEGSSKKLKSLFKSDDQFKAFNEAMEREAAFTITRRIAQGGSSTKMQQADVINAEAAIENGRAVMGDPTAWVTKLGQITSGLLNKNGSKVNKDALEEAGNILLSADMDPQKVVDIIKTGSASQIAQSLESAATRYRALNAISPSVTAAAGYEVQQD